MAKCKALTGSAVKGLSRDRSMVCLLGAEDVSVPVDFRRNFGPV